MNHMRMACLTALLTISPSVASAQEPATIVDARINRYCHPPDACVLRGALLWDTTNVAPRYPAVMRDVGIQGEVQVAFMVQPDGSVDAESMVIQHATNRAFAQTVLDAVGRWKFRIESMDRPVTATPTGMTVIFAIAERCPSGLTGPVTSLSAAGEGARLILMACPR